MSFTTAEYKTLASSHPKYEPSIWEEYSFHLNKPEGTRRYTFRIPDASEARVIDCATQALESGKFTQDLVVVWRMKTEILIQRGKSVFKPKQSKYLVITKKADKIVVERFTDKKSFKQSGLTAQRQLWLKTQNVPSTKYLPKDDDPKVILKYFHEAFKHSAPILPNLRQYSCRYPYLANYSPKSVNWAIEQLWEKGFNVSITEPFIKFEIQNNGDIKLCCRQALVVAIPKEAYVAERIGKGPHYSTYKPMLSLNNVLIDEHATNKRPTEFINIREAAENIFQNILTDIKKSAQTPPMFTRLACDVGLLSEEKCQEIVKKLAVLGFKTTLEDPFIVKSSDKVTSNADFLRRHLMIELPTI